MFVIIFIVIIIIMSRVTCPTSTGDSYVVFHAISGIVARTKQKGIKKLYDII